MVWARSAATEYGAGAWNRTSNYYCLAGQLRQLMLLGCDLLCFMAHPARRRSRPWSCVTGMNTDVRGKGNEARQSPGDEKWFCCHSLMRQWDWFWTFIFVEGVQATKNRAAAGVRSGVIWEKTSLGARTAAGWRFVERIHTIVCTGRRRGIALLDWLTKAVWTRLDGLWAPPFTRPVEARAVCPCGFRPASLRLRLLRLLRPNYNPLAARPEQAVARIAGVAVAKHEFRPTVQKGAPHLRATFEEPSTISRSDFSPTTGPPITSRSMVHSLAGSGGPAGTRRIRLGPSRRRNMSFATSYGNA
jgi:hypothetical protein